MGATCHLLSPSFSGPCISTHPGSRGTNRLFSAQGLPLGQTSNRFACNPLLKVRGSWGVAQTLCEPCGALDLPASASLPWDLGQGDRCEHIALGACCTPSYTILLSNTGVARGVPTSMKLEQPFLLVFKEDKNLDLL